MHRDGYRETIELGLQAVQGFGPGIVMGEEINAVQVKKLADAVEEAEAIVIGAGAGLSTSAGLVYDGERFEKYFYDFADTYGIRDMYSGGFYPFPEEEIRWAWWARHIYFNRYIDAPEPVYQRLLDLVKDRNYFVITTNVDHQFQRTGFDKDRLFYTQGDYGLFQGIDPADQKTYDNETWVMEAMQAQGFVRDVAGVFQVPADGKLAMRIPTEWIPQTPAGRPVTMNLRADDSFTEDAGWHRAAKHYAAFLDICRQGKVLYLELGVGANTPVIIKYPFWALTKANPAATYVCLNYSEAFCPKEIADQSICINADIGELLQNL